MTDKLIVCLVSTIILTTGYSALPSSGETCPTSLAPPTSARGVNRLDRNSNIPLFRLDVGNLVANASKDESAMYRVGISAENERFPFSDAKILISSQSDCGTGDLTFDTHHFFDASRSDPACPRLLTTNKKLPMVDLPVLRWRPPGCGCVQFRAVAISVDNVYYSDNEDVDNGPLTQTMCVHQKATRETYLSALCHVIDRYSTPEIISSLTFLQRHQLNAGRMDRHGLEMGLELRRSDNKLCCSKSSLTDKLTCFDDSRRRRVDRFCEDGYPDIPLTSFRLSHMREREKQCCFLLGEHRYTCFAENSGLISAPAVTLLDFSQDETDPVNDLAEFAYVQDTDIIKRLGHVTVGENESKNNNNGNDDGSPDRNGQENDEIRHRKPIQQASGKKTPSEDGRSIPTGDISRSESSIGRDFQRHGLGETARGNTKVDLDDENPTFTSSEKKKKVRKNREPDQKYSAERGNSRRTSSREYTADGRKASGEKTGRKRASGERLRPLTGTQPRLPAYDETYSRGTGLSREREVLSSAEKRSRTRSSGQRRQDWAVVVDEPDFEDQGGKSVDVTLDKLQKKMDRLRVRHQCCEAGASSGRPVYGWQQPVRKECEHSGQKYITTQDIPLGIRPCLDQFIKCCLEQAISGPVVTSSEFRDNQFLYINNLQKLGPLGGVSKLDRQYDDLRQPARKVQQQEFSRDIPGQESPEAYEQESERRFQSMREFDQGLQENDDVDEEINGPRQFDDTDNDFDIFERKDETVNRTLLDIDADEESDNFDNKEAEDTYGIFNKNRKQVQETDIKGLKKGQKKIPPKDQLDRENDLVESMENYETSKSRAKDDSFLARTSGGRSRQSKYSRSGGRSRSGKSSSRESRQTLQRGSSNERRQFTQTFYDARGAYKLPPSGKIGAQDSQEMAAAHSRKYTLDSKEMVDAYKKTIPKETNFLNDGPSYRIKKKKPKKQRWYSSY